MSTREGSLEAPTRHPIDWKSEDFLNEESLFSELERVFDICHGCRRCVSLCNSFPTLFDLVDESDTMEVDGVDKEDYWQVVDHCYLCDLCYLTKCPYVPPHEWNVDYPHLMLRAKTYKRKNLGTPLRDRLISSTDAVGSLAGIPVVRQTVNAANNNAAFRSLLDSTLGVHKDAVVPKYHGKSRVNALRDTTGEAGQPVAAGQTTGKVAIYLTCYGKYNQPELVEDLVAILQHNDIPVRLQSKEKCCGMPKLELGDLDAVEKNKQVNIPVMCSLIDEGYDIIAPIPSCVLMYKQELPLMFPDDADVARVRDHIFDPFEYLMIRHKEGRMKTTFEHSLGKVAYHAPCHQRVQKIGAKTRDVLELVPDTEVTLIERCSGHDGTYAVKKEYHEISMKIARPVANRVRDAEPDHYGSDCPMAGAQIAHSLADETQPQPPLRLLRKAYGI